MAIVLYDVLPPGVTPQYRVVSWCSPESDVRVAHRDHPTRGKTYWVTEREAGCIVPMIRGPLNALVSWHDHVIAANRHRDDLVYFILREAHLGIPHEMGIMRISHPEPYQYVVHSRPPWFARHLEPTAYDLLE